LLEEGRVKAEFVERPGEEPHLLYTPSSRTAAVCRGEVTANARQL
jgi:hypothetical protein